MSIQALLSHADGSSELVELARADGPLRVRDHELLWVDLIGASDDEREAVARALDLSEPARAALTGEVTRPDVTVTDGAVSVCVLMLDGERPEAQGMQILVGKNWVVTRHDRPIGVLDEHRDRITDKREVGLLSGMAFLALILEWHVDALFRIAEDLEREVDRLDDAALRTDDEDLLSRMVATRRRIAGVRRVAARHREAFAELARPDFTPSLDETEAASLARVPERLERAAESVSHARDMLLGTFDVFMTRTAQRTNDIVRVLTWASVVLLPASVIAGIMGMNFRIGFFDEPAYFFAVIGFMALLAVATLIVARMRGWL